MTEIENWAVDYVSTLDQDFAKLSDTEKLSENLFTSGRLDSMAIMNLLLDAENNFNFSFTPEAFQDRRIHKISGLSKVINELRGSI